MIHLAFDFNGQPIDFCHPLKIIEAYHLDEVIDCFHQLQQAVDDGFYIAGYVAYEAASAFTNYLSTHQTGDMPLVWFGVFDKPTEIPLKQNQPLQAVPDWQIDTTPLTYQRSIESIHDEIAQGNVYQVNYTVRLNATLPIEQSYAYYKQICHAQQANYCAYLDTEHFQLLSASPELFFHWKNGGITTKPMKGTIARGKTLSEDKQQADTLASSAKDQAENLMIVDLLRNDISKIAILNTVKVPALFTIEKYPTVLQMTSTITAETKPNTTLLDVFKALFPCGSITGAPKASAMQLITRLETTPREAYCGAIGFMAPSHEATFNVAIRTISVNKTTQQACYGVGGGITWNSTVGNEYQEVLAKTKVLTTNHLPDQLLESLLLIEGKFFLRALHLQRLKNSAHYFNFVFNYTQLKHHLNSLANQYPLGTYKVRLLLNKKGEIDCEAVPIVFSEQPLQAQWFEHAVNSSNTLLYHKTTRREFYPALTQPNQDYLLTNEQGQVTEFVNGNVVILSKGQWLTPPIHSGLLAGTLRQYLLNNGFIHEQVLYKEDVLNAEQILFINSVRGAKQVILN